MMDRPEVLGKARGRRRRANGLGTTLRRAAGGHPNQQASPRHRDEGDIDVVLARVITGDIPPPRKVNRRVPKSLEAICRKAMANNLAVAYRKTGRLDLAIPLLEETLMQRTDKPGADNIQTVTLKDNLAAVYLAAGMLDRA